jgi:hypothetical protein
MAWARETLAALSAIRGEPSSKNLIAFHELHARHLRAQGQPERADRADERAQRLRKSRPSPPESPPKAYCPHTHRSDPMLGDGVAPLSHGPPPIPGPDTPR